MEAHRRLGHVAPQVILQMVAKGSIAGLKINPMSKSKFCLACTKGKMSHKPIPKERISERSMKYGQIIHTDLWGPAQIQLLGGKSYYVSYTDDYSRETKIIFLAKKSDTYQSYFDYKAWVEKQRDATIKALQSDRGGEYLSKAFDQHLKKKGTVRRLTVHDTPEQDGVSKHLNRTAVEGAKAFNDIPKSVPKQPKTPSELFNDPIEPTNKENEEEEEEKEVVEIGDEDEEEDEVPMGRGARVKMPTLIRQLIMQGKAVCQELPPRTGLSAHGARRQALSEYARGTRRLRGDTLKTSEALRAVR